MAKKKITKKSSQEISIVTFWNLGCEERSVSCNLEWISNTEPLNPSTLTPLPLAPFAVTLLSSSGGLLLVWIWKHTLWDTVMQMTHRWCCTVAKPMSHPGHSSFFFFFILILHLRVYTNGSQRWTSKYLPQRFLHLISWDSISHRS